MKSSLFTAKTLEEALEEAKNSLNLTEEDFIYSYEETKGKLFKSGSFNVTIYTLTDIFLNNLLNPFISLLTCNQLFHLQGHLLLHL